MSALHSPAPVEAPERVAPKLVPRADPPRNPWKWIVLAVIIALVAGYAVYRAVNRGPATGTTVNAARTAKVTAGTLERTARLSGETAAGNYATIIAPRMSGPDSRDNLVILKMVASGSPVKKGDLLVQIDAQALKDHVDDVTDTVEAAEADVRKRRAELSVQWENLVQNVRLAKADWDKAKLDNQPAEIRTDIERQLLKLSLDEAEAKYREAEKNLAFEKESQAAELRILELTAARHRRHRDRHASDLKAFTIHAPISGLAVISTMFRGGEMGQIKEGDQIRSGQQLMKIVDPDSMQIEALANQAESSLLRIGQKTRIRLDGFRGVTATGSVYSIGALATAGGRQQFYIRNLPVRIKLDKQNPEIIPDLSASVNVILESAPASTIVPLGAVSTERGKTYVRVKTGNGFARREVGLGMRNETQAAVLSGLTPGDVVRLD